MRRGEADVHPKHREVSLNFGRVLQGAVLATTAMLFGLAPAARASHYLVDSGGGGDYTSIQPAINADASSPRDSILVMPGAYTDVLQWDRTTSPSVVIIATGGPSSTSMQGVQSTPGSTTNACRVVGFRFPNSGAFSGFDFRGCVFLGTISMSPVSTTSSMHDCDVYGPATFYSGGYSPNVDHCRFHSAPCSAFAGGIGSLTMSYCTFEGPCDQLLSCGGDCYDPFAAYSCTFRNATNGVICGPMAFFGGCVVEDITNTGILSEDCPQCSQSCSGLLSVGGSRFERCGTAIQLAAKDPRVSLAADTVLSCTHDAIVMTEAESNNDEALIQGLIVDGAGGNGVDVSLRYTFPAARISNCRIQNCTGFGLRVADDPSINWHGQHSYVRNVQVDHCGGPGIVVTASNVGMSGNVSWANGGDGIAMTTQWTDSAPSDSVTNNTAYGNAGAGIRMAVIGALTGVDQVVQHNLIAGNTGAGLVMANAYRGSVAFNDAWSNSGGAYNGLASPADSNLTSDPQLCNASAGDFGLHAGSPAGPSGVYGLIGASPEGCNALASVAPPIASLAFSAYPNPARGSIVFAAPATSAGRVDVVDVLGRRVWSSTLRAGESVRWDGRSDSGAARPGVYLARFNSAGTTRSLRVVWMP
jgi:hypothetical protein